MLTARSAGSGMGTGSLKNTMIPRTGRACPRTEQRVAPRRRGIRAGSRGLPLARRFCKGRVAAHVAEHDDDLAAMAFEDLLVPLRDNEFGKLRREKPL